MSEPIKKPNQIPESYQPGEKPEIINLSEHRTSKVITEGNLTYIDGVPPVKWGEWHECTYSGCMTLLLNALGAKTTYEQIMGLTGSCYRASMAYGWDPGSNIVNITYYWLFVATGNPVPDNNANRFFGIDYANIHDHINTDNDRAVCEEKVKASINSGMPVLVLGSRGAPEWGIVLGYEVTSDGFKYFGRSYFDEGASEDEIFTKNRYVLANRFPAECVHVYDNLCEPTPFIDAFKISLETCLDMFKPHEKFGYGAYDKMIQGFENNKFPTDWNSDGDAGTIIRTLIDARRAAYIFLNENAGILTENNKSKLLEVALLYKKMFDALQSVMPYKKDFDQSAMSDKMSKEIADVFRTCKELEYKAHGIIKEILDHWEE